MEKQETAQINMAHWIIVHESPLLGWLGRVTEEDWSSVENELDGIIVLRQITLHDTLVIQTTQMPLPGPGGQVQMGIITSVAAPHSLTTEALLVTVRPDRVTLVRALNVTDQLALLLKIQSARKSMLAQRVHETGLVVPGPRA